MDWVTMRRNKPWLMSALLKVGKPCSLGAD